MSATYNARALTPEVLVKGNNFAIVRPRQEIDDLINMDQVPSWLSNA